MPRAKVRPYKSAKANQDRRTATDAAVRMSKARQKGNKATAKREGKIAKKYMNRANKRRVGKKVTVWD